MYSTIKINCPCKECKTAHSFLEYICNLYKNWQFIIHINLIYAFANVTCVPNMIQNRYRKTNYKWNPKCCIPHSIRNLYHLRWSLFQDKSYLQWSIIIDHLIHSFIYHGSLCSYSREETITEFAERINISDNAAISTKETF